MIKKLLKDKKLISNFGYLSVLQMFVLLVPLITYPYFIRVLGAEVFGKVILAQIIVSYFILIINFGFDVSATKDIAIHVDDKDKIQEIVSNVFFLKTFLFIVSFFIYCLLFVFFDFMREEKKLYFFSFLLCVTEWLFPTWYFQGIEKMKYITIINIISKLFFLSMTFFLVKEKTDYVLIPLLNGIGAFFAGICALWVVIVKHHIKIWVPVRGELIKTVSESSVIFLNRSMMSIKDKFSTLVIASSLGTAEVAVFDLGLKLMGLFSTFVSIVNQTVYPKYSRELNVRFIRGTLKYIFLTTIIGLSIVHILLPYIVTFLGGREMLSNILEIHVLLIAPIFFSIGTSLGAVVMNANRRYKILFMGMGFTTFINVFLISISYFSGFSKYLLTFAVIIVITYLFEFLFRYFYCKRVNLI